MDDLDSRLALAKEALRVDMKFCPPGHDSVARRAMWAAFGALIACLESKLNAHGTTARDSEASGSPI